MMIHFIGSKGNIDQEIEYYRAISKHLKKMNQTLVRDWIEDTYGSKKEQDPHVDWSKIDSEDAEAIARADLVIVEATRKSFFVGYRMAQALQQKKPILILYRDGSFPGANDLSKGTDFIKSAEYNLDNLGKIIGKFLEENTIETKDMRFNFFIDRKIYNYLRWASLKTGKTKAAVLRDLVNDEILKKDTKI